MKQEKLLWADNLRALATCGVITLHVASTIASFYPAISQSHFLTAVFFDSAFRWCVPVFVMLSGSFALENYDNRITDFLKKMYRRIIVPFLFWSIVYLFFFSWQQLSQPGQTVFQLISFIGLQFLSGTASHLWFVYVIVSMYITFPFFSPWIKVAKEREYMLFLTLWFFFLLIDPLLSSYDINFTYTFFTGFIGYIVLGNYLFKKERKFNTLPLLCLFIIAYLYTALRTYFLSKTNNALDEFFMETLSWNVCAMSFCMYAFFKNNNFPTPPLVQKLIALICPPQLWHLFVAPACTEYLYKNRSQLFLYKPCF